MSPKKWPTAKILNIKVDFPTLKQAVAWVEEQVNYNKVGQITTLNPEQVVLAQKDLEFRNILNHAALSICDGAGLLWAAKRLNRSSDAIWLSPSESNSRRNFSACEKGNGARIVKAHQIDRTRSFINIDKLSGVDLMLALCRKAAEKNWKIFLLGGKNDVAAKAAKFLITNYQLLITSHPGANNIRYETGGEKERVIKAINKFSPHLLFVAYGAPWQEKWLSRNLPQLKVNIAMGVGGAFDYLAGKARRAPAWIRSAALEWLWRLIQEPWRLKRQLALLKFIWLVIRQKALK